MPTQKTLQTWAGRSLFKFSGFVREGTIIYYGEEFKYTIKISQEQYNTLIKHFRGQIAEAGTSRTDPPRGSVGEWLQQNVNRTAIASYVCPILIDQKYVERAGRTEIRFF